MIEISTELLSILFILAVIIGMVDAIGGGGGLITLPILMWVGLPPLQALGTSKFQLLFASLSATIYFVKNTKLLDYKKLWPILLVTVIFASVGAKAIHLFSADWLFYLIPIVLIIMSVYFFNAKNFEQIESKQRISFGIFCVVVIPLVAFYDGFLGPGSGAMFTFTFIFFIGYGIKKATANTKIINLVANFAALHIFIIEGNIFWEVAIIMALGQFIGSFIGAKIVMKHGVKIIRPILIVVCIVTSVKIIIDQF